MTPFRKTLDRARRRLAGQGGFTLPEILLVLVIAGTILGVLTSGFVVSAKTTSSAGQRLSESRDTQLVASYFGPDAANSAYFNRDARAPWSTCPSPATDNNIAMFSWKEGAVAKDAFYVRTAAKPAQLTRRFCSGGAIASEIPVARNLGTSDPVVTCRPPLGCAPVPGWVNIRVQEKSGYSYDLRNTPRAASASGGALGSFSVYVGDGGFEMQSDHTALTAVAGAVYFGGPVYCHSGASLTAGGGLYTTGDTCKDPPAAAVPSTTIPAQPDPLADLAYPPQPATAAWTENVVTPGCHGSGKSFHPGVYTASAILDGGCLLSGVHFFKAGAELRNLTAEPNKPLLIFIESGNLMLAPSNNTAVNFGNLADNDYGNVVVFMKRSNAGIIYTKDAVTVDGIIYGAASILEARTPHNDFQVTGINVRQFHHPGQRRHHHAVSASPPSGQAPQRRPAGAAGRRYTAHDTRTARPENGQVGTSAQLRSAAVAGGEDSGRARRITHRPGSRGLAGTKGQN